MKLASEIVNELRETLCWESAQPGIAYAIIAAKLKPMKEAIQFVLDDDEEWAGTMLTYKTDKALREILAMLSEEE